MVVYISIYKLRKLNYYYGNIFKNWVFYLGRGWKCFLNFINNVIIFLFLFGIIVWKIIVKVNKRNVLERKFRNSFILGGILKLI